MTSKRKPQRKNALGRGLEALLPDSNINNPQASPIPSPSSLNEIDIKDINANPFQPRTDFDQEALQQLAESIKLQGIIQPITVRKSKKGAYQLITGERRLQASKIAGKKRIPAYIRSANDQQMLEMALIENIQRENLNAIEIALSYQRLITECNLKQDELGKRMSKDRTTVTNYLRLLKLPPDIQIAVRDKKISMGHARAIISIENVEYQLAIFKKILEDDLSVRKVEELVRKNMVGQSITIKKKLKAEKNYELEQLESKLVSHFGTKVEVKPSGNNKGEIRIPYVSVEDLNRILDILRFKA
jgi:ParB family chromosome partitioning protein